MQALEMLAAESAIKVRSFDASSLDRCRQPFAEVERQFDLDDMLEEVMECEESVLLTEAGYQRAADNLHSIGCSNRQQLDQLRLLQSRLESVAVGKKTEWSKGLIIIVPYVFFIYFTTLLRRVIRFDQFNFIRSRRRCGSTCIESEISGISSGTFTAIFAIYGGFIGKIMRTIIASQRDSVNENG